MYAVSDEFLATIRGPHRLAVKIEVSDSPDGPWSLITGAVSNGSVSIDRTSDTRRTLSLSVAGFTNPLGPTDELDPYGTFIRASRGIYLSDGEPEYVPLGIFRVYSVVVDKDSVEVTGYSQEIDIKDSRFYTPWEVIESASPPSLSATLEDIIVDAVPTATVSFDASLSNPNIQRAIFEKDRMEAVKQLVSAAGGELSCDQDGAFVIRPPADVTDAPVWTVDAGRYGVLIEYSKTFTRQGVYNAVVVSNGDIGGAVVAGTTTPTPIRVVVIDNDVTSPTYWSGPFGKVPRFYTSTFIASTAQALSAGRAILLREKGLKASIDFGFVANPALDVDDVVTVVYPDGSSEPQLIDRLSIGLTPEGGMSGSTRGIQTVEEA